jgi:hypothetical protein
MLNGVEAVRPALPDQAAPHRACLSFVADER